MSISANPFIPPPPPAPPPASDADWKAWVNALMHSNHEQHVQVLQALALINETLTKSALERHWISTLGKPFLAAMAGALVTWLGMALGALKGLGNGG